MFNGRNIISGKRDFIMMELNSITTANYTNNTGIINKNIISNNTANIEKSTSKNIQQNLIFEQKSISEQLKQNKSFLDENNYFVKKEIKYLADKFENSHLYTKEASKIVAKQIVIGTIEFFA